MSTETMMVGAGCFWGVQYRFDNIHGIEKTLVGYAGGDTESPNYDSVCRGDTNHAEVVWLEFDNNEISRRQLLELFFSMHNPTTLNRQGPDIGTQYRSVIFYANDEEKSLAEEVMKQAQANFSNPIVTTLEPMADFWAAEDYHQQYFQKRGIHGGCH
ncbi:peptide-methionine (S)-S-oxide reductase MsrA [Thiomicrorhabdus sediminis]|uniref:Peptide methionine sulfoxide reductase MsrA n=1 Tax=Thiomicrorhabdus sediminis TaxID=2580412 RepID=A0A4P9K749_9GAMM|nr:peptide-methionine (S)-S-oxide reductase MsrA [Thiomicrorhabdus sediminis]QCU90156.1 peptide-methionine (S)-S-oxide reductase MsrA [Thiomicrorhabdus sediminis]